MNDININIIYSLFQKIVNIFTNNNVQVKRVGKNNNIKLTQRKTNKVERRSLIFNGKPLVNEKQSEYGSISEIISPQCV